MNSRHGTDDWPEDVHSPPTAGLFGQRKAQYDADYALDMETAPTRQLLDGYRRRSGVMLAGVGIDREQAYGPTPTETFHVAWPADPTETHLLVVFYHGGWWKAGNKDDRMMLAESLVTEGVALASVGYPLAPATPLRVIADAALRAARTLGPYGRRRTGRTLSIVLCGNSAGGHLACHVAGALRASPLAGDPQIAGLCSVSGLYDLSPLRQAFTNDWLRLSDQDVESLSPVRWLPNPAMPVLITAGAREPPGFLAQKESYARYLAQQGSPVTEVLLPDHDHFTAIAEIGRPGSVIYDWLLARRPGIPAPRCTHSSA